ncbi:MAG: HesA/MoeB/ThiF family protein, partial [Clostridia bacterium]|nr:HesA/MoeB/ThiF family protein [Clostridia bacterium]
DGDTVALSNMQRQIVHSTNNLGKAKVLSAKERMQGINPNIKIITYNEYMDAAALKKIIAEENYDFIIEATDNFDSKFVVNDVCVALKKAYSHAGVMQFQGETMTYVPGHACYRCVVPTIPDNLNPSKAILGTVAGIIGTIQATEAIKYLLGIGNLLTDYLLIYDALFVDCRKLAISQNPNCICKD